MRKVPALSNSHQNTDEAVSPPLDSSLHYLPASSRLEAHENTSKNGRIPPFRIGACESGVTDHHCDEIDTGRRKRSVPNPRDSNIGRDMGGTMWYGRVNVTYASVSEERVSKWGHGIWRNTTEEHRRRLLKVSDTHSRGSLGTRALRNC